DRKNLPDHETLTPRIHNTPKPDSGNLQKRSCFIRQSAYAAFQPANTPDRHSPPCEPNQALAPVRYA
ncbi:hypothetical protein, partial [Rhodoferax sp.]|uniref:hypothetical protein n=1 Tax=Rhodoferax sp. TaxID=50421 RepID=UPI00374D9DCC